MGMLSNLTQSIGKKLGLGGSGPDTRGASLQAAAAEKARLESERLRRRNESRFHLTEGQGLRRMARLSFGDDDEDLSLDEKSQRATGRFEEERLVL